MSVIIVYAVSVCLLFASCQPILSPYSRRTLKPFIRRDFETEPAKLKMLRAIQRRGLAQSRDHVVTEQQLQHPLDYCYVQPAHIPAVNQLASKMFWPGRCWGNIPKCANTSLENQHLNHQCCGAVFGSVRCWGSGSGAWCKNLIFLFQILCASKLALSTGNYVRLILFKY